MCWFFITYLHHALKKQHCHYKFLNIIHNKSKSRSKKRKRINRRVQRRKLQKCKEEYLRMKFHIKRRLSCKFMYAVHQCLCYQACLEDLIIPVNEFTTAKCLSTASSPTSESTVPAACTLNFCHVQPAYAIHKESISLETLKCTTKYPANNLVKPIQLCTKTNSKKIKRLINCLEITQERGI